MVERLSVKDSMKAMEHSIALDVLLAFSRERHGYLMSLIYAEEEKASPDQAIIDALEQESWKLPQWGSLPDEDHVDAEIEQMKAIVLEQRKIARA